MITSTILKNYCYIKSKYLADDEFLYLLLRMHFDDEQFHIILRLNISELVRFIFL